VTVALAPCTHVKLRTTWRMSADGSDEQMFGAKQQIPPAEQSD
jgi:hypothetical protein